MDNFTLDVGSDGVALITFDLAGRSMNTITHAVQREIGEFTETIRDDERIIGAILRSGKPTGFCAGADLNELSADIERWSPAESQEELRVALKEASDFSQRIRALETVGKPVVAIIEGVALGGGLELALGCHRRIGVPGDNLRLGLPEATLGLMPGAGGTQRLPRIVGLNAALAYILDGKQITAEDALATGILHELAAPEQAVDIAHKWIIEGVSATAPWDEKGYRLPNGGPHTAAGYAVFGPAIAARRDAARDADANILKAIYEGSQVPIGAALRIESRYFFNTLRTPAAAQRVREFMAKSRAKASAA